MTTMKKTFIALVLTLPAVCLAGPNTPALSQYMSLLQCSTKAAFGTAEGLAQNDASFARAAESCVPQDFKAELAGLPDRVTPSTRDEQVAALVRSLKTRKALCEQQKLSPPECIKMFAAAQD